LPFNPLQSFQLSTSPADLTTRSEDQSVPINGSPRKISCPSSTYNSVGLAPGNPHPTQPHPRGLITSSARYSPPNLPTILQTGALLGFRPSRPLPPHGAAPGFPGRYSPAVHHVARLRRFERRATAPGFYSPAESVTHQSIFTPTAGRCLLGLVPLQSFLPSNRNPCGPSLMSL
jgi:hypothetical protein